MKKKQINNNKILFKTVNFEIILICAMRKPWHTFTFESFSINQSERYTYSTYVEHFLLSESNSILKDSCYTIVKINFY